MKRERRRELLWELIDSMFTKVEYWNEDPVLTELTDHERECLIKCISSFAKRVQVTNHVCIK